MEKAKGIKQEAQGTAVFALLPSCRHSPFATRHAALRDKATLTFVCQTAPESSEKAEICHHHIRVV